MANYNLGIICQTGNGVDQPDLKKALHFFKEADKMGHPEGRQRLSDVLEQLEEDGEGIEEDLSKSISVMSIKAN